MFSQLLRLALIGSVLCAAAAVPSQAIPAFAKAYKMSCSSCHAYYPRLNDFGERFRRNGYQLPDGKKLVSVGSQKVFPASVRVLAQTRNSSSDKWDSTATGYIVSGGSVSKDLSFLTQYPTRTYASDSYSDQPERLQQGNVQLMDFAHSGLAIKAGRFIPSFDAFGPDYHLVAGINADSFIPNGYWNGVEISKFTPNGMSYCVGHADWVRTYVGSKPYKGTYARLAKAFGGGVGETEGHCVGLTYFSGETSRDWYDYDPFGSEMTVTNVSQDIRQLGFNASLNFGRVNLNMQYLDSKAMEHGPIPHFNFHDTLAELAYSASAKCILALDCDGSDYSEGGMPHGNFDTYSLATRYYPTRNLAVRVSYGWWFENVPLGSDDSGRMLDLGLDLSY